ncbi:MAG TPA: hypothetical protein VGG64_14000 [Pirellulales bacterium]|jgi:hypothetical protein
MNAIVPIWADAEWIKLVIPIVMFSIYILNMLLGAKSPAAKQARARQQARVNPPPPPAADKQRVEDEVGEFLRRAAQQRSGKENRPAPAAQPAKPPKPVRKPLAETAASREIATPTAVEGRPRTLATSITESYARRNQPERPVASTEITQSVESMESRLAQTFDHALGAISGSPAGGEKTPAMPMSSTANELVAMLRDPQSIREAIVISEVLRRPEERW